MNPDQLFVSSKNNAPSSRFSTIPTRVHHLYSSKIEPQFVNSNGALNLSSLTNTNLEDEFGPSYSDIGLEVRTLRKALNLPTDALPKTTGLTSNHWSHDHASRTSQVFLTDSGYSSKTNPQSVEAMQSISASRNEDVALHSGASYSVAFGLESSYDEQTNPLGVELNSWKHCRNSSKLYERSLKSSLDESETKRMLLLEKLREAHLTIQNQAEKLAATESDICFLRGQLKSMAIEQEGMQQEVDCLTMEKKKLEFFKSESLKNHEAFLIRVNDLDKELKVLTATHNTLQIEATKKGAALEKTSFYVTTLQQDIDELQKVNNVLERELSSLRDIQDQHNKSNVSKKLEQLNKDYQKILQEHAVIKHQLSESVKASDKAKLKQDQMGQEIIQLRMERDIQCGKVSVLEEEILHQQQNYKSLVKEQERLLKEKAEQDQRLQREIRDRLCLKMVNDLLREESANVKEAFQKLEEFTNSVEQRSKDMSLELDQCKQENLTGHFEEMGNEKSWNGGLLLKIASAKSHCEDLESQVSFLQETNRTLNKEKEEREKQVQLIKMREENLTKQQVSKSRELKTENEKLKLSFTMISKKNEELQKQLKHQKEEMELLKSKSKELSASVPGSHQNDSIHFLQEEVDKIKETVKRLECEKTELITELNKLHKEKEAWALQKSELEMTQAELSAENSQLRSELNNKVAVKSTENQSIANVKKKLELEKEEAVKKVKEEMQGSFDEVCLELKTVKSELSKVWDMLENKKKQVEEQSQELQREQEQSQKWGEELMQLQKDYADLTASTSSRTQMICTLRDELTQRCEEIIELEAALSFNQQKCNSLKTSPLKINGHGLKRRRSDGDINISFSHRCDMAENLHKECSGFKKLMAKNTYLNRRVDELITERDSALQDSQDLLIGMQQLREAFEEEMERELERERSKFEKEKQLLQMQSEESQQLPGVRSKLEMEVSHLTAHKVALEVKSKHLECERDELRNQVEELCRMRTAAEEKAVQVDSALSPRKRENKTSSRKRSKSVGMMSPSIQEIPSRKKIIAHFKRREKNDSFSQQ